MKDIPGYEGLYAVTEDGRVWSHPKTGIGGRRGRWFRPSLIKGYESVNLSRWGRKKSYSVHRLVARTYIDNPEDYPAINHIDGDRLNNTVSNLEWCTSLQNNRHKMMLGRTTRGTKSANHKLTEEDVHKIREAIKNGANQRELADAYAISGATVSYIKSRKKWGWLKDTAYIAPANDTPTGSPSLS